MTSNWAPIILCAAADADTLAELAEVTRLVAVSPQEAGLVFLPLEGDAQVEPLLPTAVYRDALAFVAASPEGVETHALLTAFWRAQFGAAKVPPLEEFAPQSGGAAALLGLYARLSSAHVLSLHQRNAGLMRELGVVRGAHDALQSSFEKLEAFFYQNNRSERIPATTLSVNRNQRPLTLRPGLEIEQRLPIDSGGICDVAISVRSAPKMGGGKLRISVELMESGVIAAEWEVPGAEITSGWLRLSLERALGPDLQTPILRVIWDGEEPILLNTSFQHPDPRFMPAPGSPLLALQVWKYVPGARATLPAGGFVSRGTRVVDRWNIGRSALREAVTLAGEGGQVHYSDSHTGLMVRPADQAVVAGRLEGVLRAGVRHLFGGIKNEDLTGPVVEFAYGVVPSRLRAPATQGLPDFAAGQRSEWYPLPPNEWSELHLILADSLTEDHDLFLMTRLAEGATSETPPHSCFFRVLALAGAEADE